MATWFGSSAQATDKRIAATDQAQVVQGRGQIINPGGVAYGNFKIGKGAVVSFESNADEIAADALNRVSQLGETFTQSLSSLQADANSRNAAVLGKLTELAESKQLDGEPKRNNTILLIVLGLAAAWAWTQRN
jgi:hypothetical protein